MDDADLEMIDMVYAATTREGDLYDAARKYMELQGDPGGAVFHYDSILEQTSDFEVLAVQKDRVALIQQVLDSYAQPNGSLDNPLISRGLEHLIAGKVLISEDVIPFAELSRTDYYKKVLEPLGIRWSMGWLAAGKGQKWLTFTSSREEGAGAYSAEHIARGKLFQRHIARAIHILELLEDARDTRAVFEQSIEKLPQSIVLVDDQRRVTFCNSTANNLIGASKSLSDAHGIFTVGASAHERAIFEQWWTLLIGAVDIDGASFNDFPMASVWEIEVSRIGIGKNLQGSGRRWMLTLKQSPGQNDIPAGYLVSQYGLTPSEADVCISLCRNGDAVSTAKAMGLSPNTVRSHLKSVFRKTETRNQVELALRLVSRN